MQIFSIYIFLKIAQQFSQNCIRCWLSKPNKRHETAIRKPVLFISKPSLKVRVCIVHKHAFTVFSITDYITKLLRGYGNMMSQITYYLSIYLSFYYCISTPETKFVSWHPTRNISSDCHK